MLISEAIERYGAFQEARGDAPSHRGEVARMLKSLADRAGEARPDQVAPEELVEFLREVRARPGLCGRTEVSDHTVFAYWRTLAAFFAWLQRQGHVPEDPMRKVPKPRVKQEVVRPFSQEQVRRLLAQPDTTTFAGLRDAALMVFLLDTGCRITEALSLPLAALDREGRMALVLGKGRREREVPFGPAALAWLERYLERRCKSAGDCSLVFVNQYGEPIQRQSMARRISAYGRRAGLRGVRVSPHTFRHTFSVNWLLGDGEYKGDALSLQRVLGHASPAMTARYVSLVSGDLGRLHSRLSPADRLAPKAPEPPRRQRL